MSFDFNGHNRSTFPLLPLAHFHFGLICYFFIIWGDKTFGEVIDHFLCVLQYPANSPLTLNTGPEYCNDAIPIYISII